MGKPRGAKPKRVPLKPGSQWSGKLNHGNILHQPQTLTNFRNARLPRSNLYDFRNPLINFKNGGLLPYIPQTKGKQSVFIDWPHKYNVPQRLPRESADNKKNAVKEVGTKKGKEYNNELTVKNVKFINNLEDAVLTGKTKNTNLIGQSALKASSNLVHSEPNVNLGPASFQVNGFPYLVQSQPIMYSLPSQFDPQQAVRIPKKLPIITSVSKENLNQENELDLLLPIEIRERRKDELQVIEKISKLKALEHLALSNREENLHKTLGAKKEFQRCLNTIITLIARTKLEELRSRKAFEKVSHLEKILADNDLQLRTVKEDEDVLYQELIESEKELVKADLNAIPQIDSEENLQKFMSVIRH